MKLSVLIGADSLTLRRSGVGRMTLEIVRAARNAAAIERTELLMAGRLTSADIIDQLDDGEEACAVPVKWKILIGRVPGVQVLRRLKYGGLNKKIKALAQECGGRWSITNPI